MQEAFLEEEEEKVKLDIPLLHYYKHIYRLSRATQALQFKVTTSIGE